MSPRIIFAGTPDFARVHLKALLDAGIKPVAVYTQPDRPSGRGHKLTPSPVKQLALENSIEVLTPENFKAEEDIAAFERLNADICIVVAYGLILPQRVIEAPRYGCINVHGSILPRYRGAAPIQRALLNGDSQTGVAIMKIVKALDAGDVYTTAYLNIEKDDTSGTLFEKLADLGAKTLLKALPEILNGSLQAVKQDEALVTYAAKIEKSEAMLDFNKSAAELDLHVRGLNPWPVAYFSINGEKYKVFKATPLEKNSSEPAGTITDCNKLGIEVACGEGTLRLETIQAPNKGKVQAADYARSNSKKIANGMKVD